MTEAVAYVTNEHPLYLRMALTSAGMVRRHNPNLPVHLIVVQDGSQQTILRETVRRHTPGDYAAWLRSQCDRHDLTLHLEAPLHPQGDEDFFHVNRALLAGVHCDRLLYLDADTLVFGSLRPLFDKYTSAMSACEARWVQGRGWREEYLPIPPFSSGVLLFNGGLHREWCRDLPRVIREVKRREHPVSEFVYAMHGDGLLREEFATNHWAGARGIRPRHFDREDVHLILHEQDIAEVGRSTIFHTYATHWERVWRGLRPPKRIHRKLIRPA